MAIAIYKFKALTDFHEWIANYQLSKPTPQCRVFIWTELGISYYSASSATMSPESNLATGLSFGCSTSHSQASLSVLQAVKLKKRLAVKTEHSWEKNDFYSVDLSDSKWFVKSFAIC